MLIPKHLRQAIGTRICQSERSQPLPFLHNNPQPSLRRGRPPKEQEFRSPSRLITARPNCGILRSIRILGAGKYLICWFLEILQRYHRPSCGSGTPISAAMAICTENADEPNFIRH
jgi:hypothetical protein